MVILRVQKFFFIKCHSLVSLIAIQYYFILLVCYFNFFLSSRDEFRKLKSEVDGPQFTEYELVKYRRKLDEEREAKLKGLSSSSSNKKKKKRHHNNHHHSFSRDRDRDHK